MKDTDPAIERKWIAMLRAAGPERRVQMATRLSAECRWRSMRAIATQHPHLSDVEHRLLWLKVHHGTELADRVREFLRKKQ